MDPAERRIVCKVCVRQYARYTCPRCNIGYCSLTCYKQHGESCTESFYREQAVGELQGVRSEASQRREMLELLRRVQQQQMEEEERQRPLVEALLGVTLGPGAGAARAFGEGGEREDDEGENLEDGEEDEEGEEEEEDQEGMGDGDYDDDGEEDEGQGEGEGEGERRRMTGRRKGGAEAGLEALAGVLGKDTLEKLLRKAAAAAANGAEAEGWDVEEGDLTPEEWQAFQRAVDSGQLGGRPATSAAPASALRWQPWWQLAEARELALNRTGQRLVAPLAEAEPSPGGAATAAAAPPPEPSALAVQPSATHSGSRTAGGAAATIPAGTRQRGSLPAPPEEPLPPLAALIRSSPSPLLTWHLVEVLYAYCYVVRMYGGDWIRDPEGAAAALLCLTDVLAAAGAPPAQRRRQKPKRRAGPAGRSGQEPGGSGAGSGGRGGGGGGGRRGGAAGRGAGGEAAGAGGGRAAEDGAGEEEAADGEEEAGPAPQLPQTAGEACLHVVERACAPPLGSSRDRAQAISVLYDTVTLLDNGQPSVLVALADTRRLVQRAAAAAATASAGGQTENAGKSGAARPGGVVTPAARVAAGAAAAEAEEMGASEEARAARARLAGAERKLWFFLVWANELMEDALGGLAAQVAEEWRMQQATLGAMRSVAAGGEVGQGWQRPGEVMLR